MDNSAIVGAFDLKTGKQLWEKTLGTLQKGSPVLADGKLYVGTENGKFYILKPSATGVEVLDEDAAARYGGTGDAEPGPESIVASPIVADGRVYVASMDALYAIGPKTLKRRRALQAPCRHRRSPRRGRRPPRRQVFPYEVTLMPGQAQTFTLSLFDAKRQLHPRGAGRRARGRSSS